MARGASADQYGSFGSVPNSASVNGSGAGPQNIHADPADFGGAIATGLQKLGATGDELVQHYQEMAVHTATNDAYVNGYAPAVNDLVSNYKKLAGTDALQQLPVYQKQLQDLNNQYLNTGSPMQRELMGSLVSRHTISTLDNMSNHADQQYTQHENMVTAQSLKNANDEAANNWQDPAQVDFNVKRAIGLKSLDNLRTVGSPTDATTKAVSDQMSKEAGSAAATSAINMALDNGDYKTANFYKNTYGDILSGKDKLQVEKSVSSLNINDNAKSYVDNLLTGAPAVIPGTPHYEQIQTKSTVATIAQKENFDPNIAFALHGTESDYGRGISPDSARKDDFQTDIKLRDKGFEGDDLASSAHNAFKIWNENSSDLKQRLGRDTTPSEGYLAYNQGGLGASTLLNAGPNDTAVKALSTIMSPKDAMAHVTANGGNATMAASDFSNLIQSKFETHYDAQKVTVPDGDVASAITGQAKTQLPAIQPASNPHEYFAQVSERLPAAQAAVDAIPDDKVREASQKQLKLKYEQAKLSDSAWKNVQADQAQKIAQDPRYASMDEVPQTVKNNLQAAGQLKFLETALNDKNNPKKDNTFGPGFLPTLDRLATDDPTDRIADIASLQQTYADKQDLHSSGFRQLSMLLKGTDTPEGKSKIASQSQFLNDLHDKMVSGENDVEGKAAFEKTLPLFFNAYNTAVTNKDNTADLLSLDPGNKNSFVAKNGISVPTPAQMTSKKIEASIGFISGAFGANRGALPGSNPIAAAPNMTPAEKVALEYNDGKITQQQKDSQLAALGVVLTPQVPRSE